MPASRFLTPLVVSLALLFAQQGGIMHAVQHIVAEQSEQKHKKVAGAHDCEQCISYAQIGGAVSNGNLNLALHSYACHIQATLQETFPFVPARAASARGPPTGTGTA